MALRPLFCLFLSGRLRQVSLYSWPTKMSHFILKDLFWHIPDHPLFMFYVLLLLLLIYHVNLQSLLTLYVIIF